MTPDFPYISFLDILEQGRKRLVADVAEGDTDLYLALYKGDNSRIYGVYVELYELKWLRSHWDAAMQVVEQHRLSAGEKKQLIALFSEWYSELLKQWSYTAMDGNFFTERLTLLQELIVQNSKWEQNLKKMQVSFDKSEKILNDKLKELKGSDTDGSMG